MNANKIANLRSSVAPFVDHGTVTGEGGGNYTVTGPSGSAVATVAFGCLVQPIVGDKVMYTCDTKGACYILAVLERTDGQDSVVRFPGDVVVEAAKGKIAFASADGIDMCTANSVNVLASDISISAEKGQASIAELQANGDSFTGAIKRVTLFSNTIEMVADSVVQRLKSCFRWVEQIEQVRAGQMVHKVRNLFSVRARQTTLISKADVKIDGKRVRLG